MKTKRVLHAPNMRFEYDKHLFGKSSDVRIYRNATLLAPGSFIDALSATEVKYPKETLKRTAENWKTNYLNINHSIDVLDRIGRVENPHFSDGKVKGDIYIHPITRNAKDTISLIDEGLVNWLSVEIITEDKWNKDNERYVDDLEYIGLAVVTEPACSDAQIKEDGPSFVSPF